MQKINFIPGLGEKPQEYPDLSKYLNIVDIDWNNGEFDIGKVDVLVGFSMGAEMACEYAIHNHLKTLVLCSLSPGAETLEKVNADEVIFLVGEKEKWVLKDIERLKPTLKGLSRIVVIPNAEHKITGDYQNMLIEIINNLI